MTVSSNDQIPVDPMSELLVATVSKPHKTKIRFGWLTVFLVAVLMWMLIGHFVLSIF